jgi:hypothetical protein
MGTGPWRGLLIRRGYDPRSDPEARKYQSVAYTLPGDWYVQEKDLAVGWLVLDEWQRLVRASEHQFVYGFTSKDLELLLCACIHTHLQPPSIHSS